jgi:hypothetical protein
MAEIRVSLVILRVALLTHTLPIKAGEYQMEDERFVLNQPTQNRIPHLFLEHNYEAPNFLVDCHIGFLRPCLP